MLYQKAGAASLSGRETEIAAFRTTLQALEAANDEAGRIRSLGRNHDLWSALVKDLALDDNALPAGIKQSLIALGLWSMQYSTAAILRKLSAEPLIAVNRNVLEGLMAQPTSMTVPGFPNSPEIAVAV